MNVLVIMTVVVVVSDIENRYITSCGSDRSLRLAIHSLYRKLSLFYAPSHYGNYSVPGVLFGILWSLIYCIFAFFFSEYESEDGEDEGREYDYMSDSGSDSE